MTLLNSPFPRRLACLGLVFFLGAMPLAQAHEGHDEAPAASTGASAPRFVASSELFELVGIVEGRKLTLYLDHASDNRPVQDAQLGLEWAGKPLPVKAVAPGQYEAELPAPLAEGETAVNASIVAGGESDLLAADLDWHAPEAAPAASTKGEGARTRLFAGAAGLLGVGFGLWSWWRERRRSTQAKAQTKAQSQGGAA